MPRKRKEPTVKKEMEVEEVPRLLRQYFQEKEGRKLTDQEILEKIRRK